MLNAAPAFAEQARSVPDAPASFTLSGNQRWVVVSEHPDGEAAIGLARDWIDDNPQVQVARARSGKYAVLVGPQAELSADQLKEKFERWAPKNLRQSRGEEFVARAWRHVDARLASAEMQEGRPVTLNAGQLAVMLRVQKIRKKKDDETFVVVATVQEDGKPVITMRSEGLYSSEPPAKAAIVKLEGATPQAVFGYYTGGAHCCIISTIATKDASGKWRAVQAAKLDGDYGLAYEDLDGDGIPEMLSGDNAFLYQFDSYASSRTPAKIEKLIGGKIVDVTREPRYRRYHQQYLAAMEARAEPDDWKAGGFLSAWVAQKVLLGEGAHAFAQADKLYDRNGGAPFEECTIKRPIEKCPAKNKRTVSFTDALRKFLNENGYR